MTDDNVIELAAHRGRATPASLPAASRNIDRSKEATDILEKLRCMPRIREDDRPIVARNLGRLLIEIEPESPKSLAKAVLQSSFQKRKRYIRLPGEPVGSSLFYAASGLEFAGIIERLAEERIKRGFDRGHAMLGAFRSAAERNRLRQSPRMVLDARDREARCQLSENFRN
jgi:hypothetical protein